MLPILRWERPTHDFSVSRRVGAGLLAALTLTITLKRIPQVTVLTRAVTLKWILHGTGNGI
jgi:hypothetical protein